MVARETLASVSFNWFANVVSIVLGITRWKTGTLLIEPSVTVTSATNVRAVDVARYSNATASWLSGFLEASLRRLCVYDLPDRCSSHISPLMHIQSIVLLRHR